MGSNCVWGPAENGAQLHGAPSGSKVGSSSLPGPAAGFAGPKAAVWDEFGGDAFETLCFLGEQLSRSCRDYR